MLLGVLDLVEVQLDRLGETAQRLRDRAALAGHIDLEALRHVPVFFLVYGSSEVSRRIHNPSVASPRSFVCPTARDADRPELPRGSLSHGAMDSTARSDARRPAPTRRSPAYPRPWAYSPASRPPSTR